jgi:alkanesulfonate monooxygenase SsuD/methylene tetrahydromethanopterin reductase-like flavin-dependent oxidoreductase (luciferase family)
MKVSLLCGAHYEGAEAYHLRPPASPAQCDSDLAARAYDHALGHAALADELGFDWVSVSEHHASPLIMAPSVAPLAGALTQVAKRARIALLGPLAPINNPLRVAEEVAMLDQLSHGRIILLPLRGAPTEFNVYGPLNATETQPRTQEATRLMRKALEGGETFTWNGEYFQYPTVAIWPTVVQRPHPPMYFSGNSANSAVFAASEHLGVCLSFYPTSYVAETVRTYRRAAADHGWRPTPDDIVYRNYALVAESDARAAELETNFLPPSLRFFLRGPSPVGPFHAGDGQPEPQPRMLFAGSPDTVVERMRAFQEQTGVGVIDLMFSAGQIPPEDVQRSIELFGREVLPRIQEFAPVA